MPPATSILDPNSLAEILQMIRQKRATGQYVSDSEERNAFAGVLKANEEEALRQRSLDVQRKEWQQQFDLQKKAYNQQNLGSMITGLFGAGKFGMQGYDWLKKNNIWGVGGGADAAATTPAVSMNAQPSSVGGGPGSATNITPAVAPQPPAYTPAAAPLISGDTLSNFISNTPAGTTPAASGWLDSMFNVDAAPATSFGVGF